MGTGGLVDHFTRPEAQGLGGFYYISMRYQANFLNICFPPSLGSIILSAAAKEFLFKGFFLGLVPVRLPPLKTPLDLQKVVVKPNVFSQWAPFSHSWFEHAPKLFIYLNVLPARAGSTFLQIGASSCSTKIQFFGLDVPPNAFLPHLGCKVNKQNTL